MLRSAEEHAAQESQIVALVLQLFRSLWSLVRPGEVAASWSAVQPQVVRGVSVGQLSAARPAASYVAAALAEQGRTVDPVATVVPEAFSGFAADGRDLGDLLDWPVTGRDGALDLIGRGMEPTEALRQAEARLERIVATTVQDAGRGAVGVEIAARERVGYVRVLTPPACARCVILAGKWFRYNEGFLRHPNCDCRHVPAAEADAPDLVTDPFEYVNSLTVVEQDRLLTKAAARAYRQHGADLNQLVNSRMRLHKGGLTTSVGTTRRGLAGGRRKGQKRLTPEGIFRIASDRDEVLSLLRQHGYVI